MNKRIRTGLLTAVLLFAAALALSGCGGKNNDNNGGNTNTGTNNGGNANTGASSGGEQTITVKASNFKFDQPEIHVKQGDKVTIKLVDEEGLHGFAIPDYDVDIKENEGTATFTADKAGEHPYHCSIVCGSGHANMVGKLIVD
ncbi:cupredoxin domain-containing protein [Paenibacillus sacheonensis]|uniref:Cytochrome C oxidase subunit II n=1 Tax=Paenibacillus sacheonensis TaxID=742054 RepID=A0A7X4YN95_9BACL|nr:cupredoxin domain-containing protein [Paenibacillus sacheonensis]MBM7565605.1 cytochrome c oxidase subunit 2 [Paenibacillus sacheonensis]NBC69477.1 cytochrome C oxidase subunit II [Paenibacillus sacheonensis]